MYILSVETGFSAAHSLRDFPGKCSETHGHNWKVKVDIKCHKLDNFGMVMDFDELTEIVNEVVKKLDHKNLNEIDPFSFTNPTSENIARYIYSEVAENLPNYISVKSVQVWESDTTSVIYSEEY